MVMHGNKDDSNDDGSDNDGENTKIERKDHLPCSFESQSNSAV